MMNEPNQNLMAYQEAVQKIKSAILQSRYRTAANANAEMLNLYYGVGEYISANSRSGKWGTGAIEAISAQLQGELPGLRGFSPTNMKNMRIFYEQWSMEIKANRQLPTTDFSSSAETLNHQLLTDDLEIIDKRGEPVLIRQLSTAELGSDRIAAFCRVGFTHHREILRKCKDTDERWYYIFRCAAEFWSVSSLKNHIHP